VAGSDDALVAGQIEYYRARAPEYDEWFLRRGPYDHGPELAAVWERETADVAAALAGVPLDGAEVLELAPGTGAWTVRYVDRVARGKGRLRDRGHLLVGAGAAL
jgi:hypothetical protein